MMSFGQWTTAHDPHGPVDAVGQADADPSVPIMPPHAATRTIIVASAGGLPPDHPERLAVAGEVHARPYEVLQTPVRASHVAVLIEAGARGRERDHVVALCERFGVAPPHVVDHVSIPLGPLRLKWERHGEFSAYTFFVPGSSRLPFSEPACGFLPAGWLAAIPGTTIYAAHAELVAGGAEAPAAALLGDLFGGNVVAGAEIGDGAGLAYTDFVVNEDGYSRFLVLDRSLTPRQAGRMLQRLFDIDAYRTLALLALPIAHRVAPRILEIERLLETLTKDIAREGGDDEALLAELTRLAAEVETTITASQFRFGAGRAYYDLVRARITELRERRLAGVQTIDEFMARRLAPAMATCTTTAQRLHDLSERVAQTSGLLSTRVEIAREAQNQALLASMDRRASLQLRLQETVEGLSVAAITYYVVGLIGYAAKALKAGGVAIDPELTVGIAIPLVASGLVLALWGVRRRIQRDRVRTPGEGPE
jgi:uncharacterized membrane-anchored protein